MARRGAARRTRGRHGIVRGVKGGRRATEGKAGRGAQRGRHKGEAPTWHDRGTPWQEPHGGEMTREETGEEPQQQKSSVALSPVHAGRRAKNTKPQNQRSKDAGRPPKKTERPGSATETRRGQGEGTSDGERGSHKVRKDRDKEGAEVEGTQRG